MVALLGVPWDGGASFERGAAAGPAAIRRRLHSAAGIGHAESGRAVLDILVDCGDAEFLPDERAALAAIQVAAEQAAEHGPVLALGGDHSVSLPLLRAAAARQQAWKPMGHHTSQGAARRAPATQRGLSQPFRPAPSRCWHRGRAGGR